MKTKHRFFIKNFVKTQSLIIDNKDIVHQCYKVLRLMPEDFIAIFNGNDNTDYIYQITVINKNNIGLLYRDEYSKKTPAWDIHLYQAIPNKLSKLEFIIQKCSETWVRKITFFRSHYSQDPKFLSLKKIERLEKIAIESAEQSHRNSIVELDFNFDFTVKEIHSKQIYCFHTKNENSKKLKNISVNTDIKIVICVWPEWGFHDDEVKTLQKQWAELIHLWDNILRTESVWFWVSFFITQQFFN